MMIVSSKSQINIRSKLISLVEPKVLCREADGELGSLVTEAEEVEDFRPFPRGRPRVRNLHEIYTTVNINNTGYMDHNLPSELDFRLV